MAVAFALPALAPAQAQAQSADHPGKAVYDQWCAACHGVDGDGEGPAAAYMMPQPRDFTRALYQIRNTRSGALPTDDDILHVIDEGMPGTSMPGWEGTLSGDDREALLDYIKSFSPFFENLPPEEPIEITDPPPVTDEGLAEGREFYESIECWKCHGLAGRGDGPSAPTLEDDVGRPVRAADLSENWFFNGGGATADIHRRLRTGLDGTPMPSFSDLIQADFMTEEQLWHLSQYVRSLSPDERPPVRDVVRSGLVEGELPSSPGDSLWADAERFYIPLVGQVIVRPRWFAPTVDGVWVEALHDGEELALRLTWNDPSFSPDAAWLEWQEKVAATMAPEDGTPIEPALRADAIAVQFPQRIPEGRELPYFLMGDSGDPVYLWHWRSAPESETGSPAEVGVDPEAAAPDTAALGDALPEGGPRPAASALAAEAVATGLAEIEPLPGEQQALRTEAVYDEGRWRVVMRRSLTTVDSAAIADGTADTPRLQFRTGTAIPMALFAWDGSNGEEGRRSSISSWYYIYLDYPTPNSVYTTPVLAMMMTAGLGLFVVVRAQRREQERSDDDHADPDDSERSDEPTRRTT